jgi:hypothetical protein
MSTWSSRSELADVDRLAALFAPDLPCETLVPPGSDSRPDLG